MISHTVYRARNNAIILQLLSADAPLANPEAIEVVELCLGGVEVDTSSPHIAYDPEDGTLTASLGRIDDVQALVDGVYEVEVTGYQTSDEEGTVFGSFQIYLRDWCEASNGS